MSYAEKINGEWVVKTVREFNIERGSSISSERVHNYGLLKVEVDPEPDAPGQIVEHGPIVDRDGKPAKTWTVRDATPEEIETRRQQSHDQVRAGYSRAMEPLSQAYPPEEREGWAEQVAAAQEVLAGGQNDLIDALRAPTGETAQEMAQAIVAKRQQYLAIYGQITAARRALDAQIAAATTLAEIEAVDIGGGYGL